MKDLLSLCMVRELGAGTICLIRGVVQVVGLLLQQMCMERPPRAQVFCILCWLVGWSDLTRGDTEKNLSYSLV